MSFAASPMGSDLLSGSSGAVAISCWTTSRVSVSPAIARERNIARSYQRDRQICAAQQAHPARCRRDANAPPRASPSAHSSASAPKLPGRYRVSGTDVIIIRNVLARIRFQCVQMVLPRHAAAVRSVILALPWSESPQHARYIAHGLASLLLGAPLPPKSFIDCHHRPLFACPAVLPLLRGSTIAAKSGPYGRSGCPSQINRSTGNPWPDIALGYRGSPGSPGLALYRAPFSCCMPREPHFLTRGGSGQLYAFPAAGRFCHFGRHARLHRLPRPMVVRHAGNSETAWHLLLLNLRTECAEYRRGFEEAGTLQRRQISFRCHGRSLEARPIGSERVDDSLRIIRQ